MFIHPFDHPDVIAGQGTVGLEVLDQCPDVATVVVCTGGGGLVSGIAAAVKARRPDVKVVAVQAEAAAAFPGSLAAGHPVALPSMSTMADGIAVASPGDLTFAHVRGLVDEVRTVTEEDLSRALLFCLERAKLVVEPAGVAAVAAVLADPTAFAPPVVAVVSGGNIDPVLLLKVVQHGMAAGRPLPLAPAAGARPARFAGRGARRAGRRRGERARGRARAHRRPSCTSARSRCSSSSRRAGRTTPTRSAPP